MNLGGRSSELPKSGWFGLSQGLQTSMLPAPPLWALPVPTAVWGVLAAHVSPLSGQTEPTAPPCRPGAPPQGMRRQGSGLGVAEAGRRAGAGSHSLWSLCLLGSSCAGCTCSVPQGAARGGGPCQGMGVRGLALPALNPAREVRAGSVCPAPLVQPPLSQ